MSYKKFLEQHGACKDAIDWVGDRTLDETWLVCERADWMFWILPKLSDRLTHEQIVLLVCECVETVLHLIPEDENRPRRAIEVTKAWANGNATIEEVRKASYASTSANAAAAAISYASSYAHAAHAAHAYAAAAHAAHAYAAAHAAAHAYAASYAASCAQHIKMCNIIRKKVPSLHLIKEKL